MESALAYSPGALLLLPMLAWSMNLFRVRGIQLSVHFSFFLLLAYVAWLGWNGDPTHGVRGGWATMFLHVTLLLVCFTCVVLHEFGHSLTAMRFGVGVRRILLMPIGGMAEFDSIPRQPMREFLITIAGPAVNFVIAAALWVVVGLPEGWGLFRFEYATEGVSGFFQVVLHWNLLMGLFNLVPVFPMDGGRIFRAVLALRLPYLRATFVAATVGKALALLAITLALGTLHRPMLALLFAFIFFAGELEYRAAKRRETEDAHWRAMMARLYEPPPSTQEPPLLTR